MRRLSVAVVKIVILYKIKYLFILSQLYRKGKGPNSILKSENL